MPYSITVSRTSIYPGRIHILLTINVNTRLQSRELSPPLPLGAISLAIGVNTDTCYQLIISQSGHNPHGYNPVTYLRHNLNAISLAVSVNTHNSNQYIDVSNRKRSTRLLSYQRHYHWARSRLLCQPDKSDLLIKANTQGTISIHMFQRNENYIQNVFNKVAFNRVYN